MQTYPDSTLFDNKQYLRSNSTPEILSYRNLYLNTTEAFPEDVRQLYHVFIKLKESFQLKICIIIKVT